MSVDSIIIDVFVDQIRSSNLLMLFFSWTNLIWHLFPFDNSAHDRRMILTWRMSNICDRRWISFTRFSAWSTLNQIESDLKIISALVFFDWNERFSFSFFFSYSNVDLVFLLLKKQRARDREFSFFDISQSYREKQRERAEPFSSLHFHRRVRSLEEGW